MDSYSYPPFQKFYDHFHSLLEELRDTFAVTSVNSVFMQISNQVEYRRIFSPNRRNESTILRGIFKREQYLYWKGNFEYWGIEAGQIERFDALYQIYEGFSEQIRKYRKRIETSATRDKFVRRLLKRTNSRSLEEAVRSPKSFDVFLNKIQNFAAASNSPERHLEFIAEIQAILEYIVPLISNPVDQDICTFNAILRFTRMMPFVVPVPFLQWAIQHLSEQPNPSPLKVTAKKFLETRLDSAYKLSFDKGEQNIPGRDAYELFLEHKCDKMPIASQFHFDFQLAAAISVRHRLIKESTPLRIGPFKSLRELHDSLIEDSADFDSPIKAIQAHFAPITSALREKRFSDAKAKIDLVDSMCMSNPSHYQALWVDVLKRVLSAQTTSGDAKKTAIANISALHKQFCGAGQYMLACEVLDIADQLSSGYYQIIQ